MGSGRVLSIEVGIEGLGLVSQGDLPPKDNFLKQLAGEYNRHIGRPRDSVVEMKRLIAWLNSCAERNGLTVLENQILLHRPDVRTSVLERGEINICCLRLWMITYGAHELDLDNEMLAETIVRAMSLQDEGNSTFVAENKPKVDYSMAQAVERLSMRLREQRVA